MNIYRCFPGGKFKALTLSYDDGRIEDRRLVSLFNEYGLKATFNLNSGLMHGDDHIGMDEAASLYKGHEVACHTVTHPTLARSPLAIVSKQILEDREALESAVHYPVRGMAYPNGSHSMQIRSTLPGLGIEYARVVGNSGAFGLPEDPYQWQATCHHNVRLMEHAEAFIGFRKSQYLYLMYVWGHSYEFSMQNTWDLIENFCRLVGKRDDIWYATNIEIIDYINACDRLKFTMDSKTVYNPSATSVWLSVGGIIKEIPGGQTVDLTV